MRLIIMQKCLVVPGEIRESKFRCSRLKSYLPVDQEAGRKFALVQFWSTEGGLRTVRARDIVDIRK